VGGWRRGARRRRPSPGVTLPRLLPKAVHHTRIYTRTGDAGTTALGDGTRVAKTDPRIEAYADVDETNAAIGVAIALGGLPDDVRGPLKIVQNDLFDVGADLCAPIVPDPPYPPLRVTDAYITRLESWCDEFNARLSKLDSFILPGGTPGASLLHMARTVARRAERRGWTVLEADAERTNPLALVYLNRLSDLLFILARVANPGDVKWVPGGQRGV
jgi:cob(I)alamin adenosyltransferase